MRSLRRIHMRKIVIDMPRQKAVADRAFSVPMKMARPVFGRVIGVCQCSPRTREAIGCAREARQKACG